MTTSIQEQYPEEVEQTAKHIGIMSRGCLNTLWAMAQKAQRKELGEKIEKMKKDVGISIRTSTGEYIGRNEAMMAESYNQALTEIIKIIKSD